MTDAAFALTRVEERFGGSGLGAADAAGLGCVRAGGGAAGGGSGGDGVGGAGRGVRRGGGWGVCHGVLEGCLGGRDGG